METVTVDAHGRIIIPAELRRRLGISPGTQLLVAERCGAVMLCPSHKVLYENLAGILAGDGPSMTRELVREHARDRAREEMEIHRWIEGKPRRRKPTPVPEPSKR